LYVGLNYEPKPIFQTFLESQMNKQVTNVIYYHKKLQSYRRIKRDSEGINHMNQLDISLSLSSTNEKLDYPPITKLENIYEGSSNKIENT